MRIPKAGDQTAVPGGDEPARGYPRREPFLGGQAGHHGGVPVIEGAVREDVGNSPGRLGRAVPDGRLFDGEQELEGGEQGVRVFRPSDQRHEAAEGGGHNCQHLVVII